MQLKSKKLLFDISEASGKISKFLDNKSWDDYCSDELLRSGVERQFEIIGEALNQLSKKDTTTIQKITDYQQIISFRNILIHGYANIDDQLVWNIVITKLPILTTEVKRLMNN